MCMQARALMEDIVKSRTIMKSFELKKVSRPSSVKNYILSKKLNSRIGSNSMICYVLESYSKYEQINVDIKQYLIVNGAEEILNSSSYEEITEEYVRERPSTSNVTTATEENGDKVNMEYKRKAVEYWKSGKPSICIS